MTERRKVITVIGSGDSLDEAAEQAPFELGCWIGISGFHLLTGGGDGVMAAVSRGFCSVPHAGLSIGIIPAGKPAGKYPNAWVELPITTHLRGDDPRGPDSRNHINVLTADAIVAFPGGAGSQAELEIALQLRGSRPALAIVACLRPNEHIGGMSRNAVVDAGVRVEERPGAVRQYLASVFAIEPGRTRAP